jgi:hypothetical protein
MALMGTTEQRLACLKISAAMNKRLTKDDEKPTPEELIGDAKKYEEYIQRGWREDD